MRSLWLRLTGAFVLVILLYAIVDATLMNRATRTQFSQYTSKTGLAWAERMAPSLEQYYALNGGWQGVENALQSPWMGMPSMMNGNMNHGMGMGDWQNQNWQNDMMMGEDAWGMMGFHLVLADGNGQVLTDSSGQLTGTKLTPTDLETGVPLVQGSFRIGTLLAIDDSLSPNSTSNEFLRTLNATTWQASLAAALFALVLGALLFRQIIAPVQAVTTAARQIADGDLAQRVPEYGSDEISQLAHTFNQMADALAHDRQLRQNMTADIAHELRTPLSIIQGNLEAMLDGVLPTSPEEIASLHEETSLLNRLVSDLRLLSLAEAGQLHLNLADTDLISLLKQTISSLRPTAETLRVTLATDFPASFAALQLDSDRINQVLHNLLSNALRYTPDGGTVTIRAYQEDKSARVEISDTGPGIPADALPYVFNRFYRADKSRNRSGGGSGIGLTIVRQLTEAHGGQVAVESPIHQTSDGPGYGTRFTLTFPIP